MSAKKIPEGDVLTKELVIANKSGIHARPAAVLAGTAKKFTSELCAAAHGRRANARSAVGWMSLGLRKTDVVTLEPPLIFTLLRMVGNEAQAPLRTNDSQGSHGRPRNGFCGWACCHRPQAAKRNKLIALQ